MTLALQYLNRPMGLRLKIFLLHAGAWALFIFYELALLFFFSGKWGRIGDQALFYALNISLFYFHAAVILPMAFKSKPIPYLIFLILLPPEIGLYLLTKYFLDYLVEGYRLPLNEVTKVLHYAVINMWRCLYFLGFSTVYGVLKRIYIYRLQMAEAERKQFAVQLELTKLEKDMAELRYAGLQQQISPHFLFNTLNFVYNSVYKHSPEASKCIVQLSELMRYSIRDDGGLGKADLADEIEQIRNLVAINEMRYDFQLYLDIDIDETVGGIDIIPLILLTFAENVFKHGYLKDPSHPARLSLSVSPDNKLKFTTWNLKKKLAPHQPSKSIGLQNTVKRLDHTYKGDYELNIVDQPGEYLLELNLLL